MTAQKEWTRDDQLAHYSALLADMRRRKAEIDQAEKEILSHIRDLIGTSTGTIHADGLPVFEVSYGKRFSPDLAAEVLSSKPEILEAISESKPSAKLAKAILSGELYGMCQAPNKEATITPVES